MATHTREVVRFDEAVANRLVDALERLQTRIADLERRLAVGLQMTDAQLDIIGGVLPTPERYPDLARVLSIAPKATIGQWRDAIQSLKQG
jgi:predicted ATP-dependent serine protease